MSTEQRAFLAVVLMAGVLILYQVFFMPAYETPPAGNTSATAPKPAPQPAPSPAPAPPLATPTPAAAAEGRPPQRIARVSGPLYDAAVSSEGGKLQEMTLKYRGEKPMIILGELGPAGLVLSKAPGAPGEVVPFQLSAESVKLSRDKPAEDLRLTSTYGGLKIEQTMRFQSTTYAIEVLLRVRNETQAAQTPVIALPWSTRQAWNTVTEKFPGQHPLEIVWQTNHQVHRHDNLCDVPPLTTEGEWIALDGKFYLSALAPKSGGFRLVAQAEDKKVCETKSKDPVGRATIAVQASPTIAPQATWEGAVLIYVGPKEYERLRALGLEGSLNFGSFLIPQSWTGGQPLLPMAWLTIPIILLLDWVHRHVGNYGLAIVLLTIVSKVLFYPLTVKSMRSMKAMQALQPQINALRNKYKSDPQRLQRETMDLYRQHKVNPMGGCLPMLAQVPIFYALYLALDNAADLQGAPFVCFGRLPTWVPGLGGSPLWICDLAVHDPTYILPILMGVTMFIQQKMTPVGGDPRQAKMMLIMPFIFTFMFLNLPSGLVLYWTVSNILQILQQWYMDRPKRSAAARA